MTSIFFPVRYFSQSIMDVSLDVMMMLSIPFRHLIPYTFREKKKKKKTPSELMLRSSDMKK